MNVLRQYAQAIIAALLIASWLALGIFAYRAGGNAVVAKQAKEDAKLAAIEERAQQGAATAIAKIKPINRNTYNEVQRETRYVPDYSACQHSADGLRGVNAALTNQPFTAGDRIVPGADAPR